MNFMKFIADSYIIMSFFFKATEVKIKNNRIETSQKWFVGWVFIQLSFHISIYKYKLLKIITNALQLHVGINLYFYHLSINGAVRRCMNLWHNSGFTSLQRAYDIKELVYHYTIIASIYDVPLCLKTEQIYLLLHLWQSNYKYFIGTAFSFSSNCSTIMRDAKTMWELCSLVPLKGNS